MKLVFNQSFTGSDKNVGCRAPWSLQPSRKSRKDKLEILLASQISSDFHEIGILSGYRKPSASLASGILSIFQLHNETLNIWTQIIPTVYFVIELILNFFHAGERFLLIYLVTAVTFLFTSSCAHTLSCLSPRARHVCFFLDYIGITLYSCGCAVCYYAFALPLDFLSLSPVFYLNLCDLFLFISVMFCICGAYLSCQTRFWKPSLLRNVVRMGAFSINLFYLATPILWRSYICRYMERDYDTSECCSLYYWNLHFMSAFAAGLLYVSHFPERLFPGKFDFFGHSHQIFHILSAFGSVTQYYALRTDLKERSAKLKLVLHAPSIPFSLLCLCLVILCDLIIFLKFYKRLCIIIRSKRL
ncbi:Membrane progestin receptor delta [Schistosoma japonicum]|uniref:Membrane progestin receptor delta n=1 Tax=Schistosoma japonicum TaxID=6182 RepID=A0A4Z2CQ84_SCHJA|nr:Membrane progestin receptor delta [Schistosoma japonicum]